MTALIAASSSNMPEIVKLLLKKKINLDLQDMYGRTALHAASFGGYTDIVEQLLKKKPSLDLQDIDGCTALHCASSGGHIEVVQLLLQAEADATVRNKHKLVPAQVAKDAATRAAFPQFRNSEPDADADGADKTEVQDEAAATES